MKTITYRLEVRATVQLAADGDYDNPDFYTEAEATAPANRRRLERTFYNWLCNIGREIGAVDRPDVELMDFTIEDDGLHGGDCGCEACQIERAADDAVEPRHD